MNTYARIDNGNVVELLETNGNIAEMFHPSLVWVNVTGNVPRIGWRQTQDGFEPPAPHTATPEQIEAQKVAVVQAHMDTAAQALRYDSITTAITYAEEPSVPKFQAEGQALRAWRSVVWAACYAILAEVQAGHRAIPTDEELIAELPPLEINYEN